MRFWQREHYCGDCLDCWLRLSIPNLGVAALTSAQKQQIEKAVKQGQAILKEGGSKADAARTIFAMIHELPRDSVIEAFIKGATITPKGAPTYYYNVSRKFKRQKGPAEK